MNGGSAKGTKIHDMIKEKLQTEFGYSKEEAAAVKSILYDMAKERIGDDVEGKNLKRAEEMEKMLTKTTLKKITSEMIEDRMNMLANLKKESGARKTSKKASRKASRKASKKASKKSGSKVTKKPSKKGKKSSKKM